MSAFADRVAAARRLAILELLADAPSYESSQSVLYQALPDQGLSASDDQVSDDLYRMAELGLVTCREVADLTMARITQRGLDVAAGRSRAPGVARPRP